MQWPGPIGELLANRASLAGNRFPGPICSDLCHIARRLRQGGRLVGGCERREESTTRWFRFRIGPFWPSGNRALACSIAKRETLDPTSPGACGNQVTEMSDFDGLLRRYYENPTIRERMCEFLGGAEPWNASAAYLVGTDGVADYTRPSSTKRLPEYLEAGLEVDRSLWDRDLMIVDIDLEYHNFDNPAIPWLDPERAFVLQKPVLDTTLRILAEAGIVPLTLMSGRGYHLVWSIRRSTRAFCRLVKLGRVPPSLKARYQHAFFPGGVSYRTWPGTRVCRARDDDGVHWASRAGGFPGKLHAPGSTRSDRSRAGLQRPRNRFV